jgi:hemoglobin-like flavoprotein
VTVDRFDDNLLETTEGSYARCRDDPDFFNEFYTLFLGKNPAIPPHFKDTDLHRQNQLLKHAIGLLMAYYKHREGALLRRIAARHGPDDLAIQGDLYPIWVDCLIEAAKRHDPEFEPEIERAGRTVIAPGVERVRHWG